MWCQLPANRNGCLICDVNRLLSMKYITNACNWKLIQGRLLQFVHKLKLKCIFLNRILAFCIEIVFSLVLVHCLPIWFPFISSWRSFTFLEASPVKFYNSWYMCLKIYWQSLNSEQPEHRRCIYFKSYKPVDTLTKMIDLRALRNNNK